MEREGREREIGDKGEREMSGEGKEEVREGEQKGRGHIFSLWLQLGMDCGIVKCTFIHVDTKST